MHFNIELALYCRIGNVNTSAYHFDKGFANQKNDIQDGAVTTAALLDMGYEVSYVIKVELAKTSVHIISVKSKPEFAMFNGMSIMREYLRHAHEINENPLTEETLESCLPSSLDIYELLSNDIEKD
jgi:hypothetical protein